MPRFYSLYSFKVAAAAAVLHASSGSDATFHLSSDKRQRRCFFLPDSGSAATFQVAGAQLW